MAGADGSTHHGAFDLAYMRCIPNMVVSAPMNESELRNLMYTAQLKDKGPFTIRYPRGLGVQVNWRKPFKEITVGQGRKIKDGEEIAILTIGHTGNFAVEACDKLELESFNPAHYDMRFVKPLDENMLHEVFTRFQKIITVEDGCITGGFGSAVAEFMISNNYSARITRLGIPDRFIDHGTQPELYSECEYDAKAIMNAVRQQVDSAVFA
jgi:1-deoxy-D-xylulose-5-phosphate synthase